MTRLEFYLTETRNPVYTVLFVVPLFIFYEALALVLHTFHITTLRNGADIQLRNLASFFGLNYFPVLIFIILVALSMIAGAYRKKHKTQIQPVFFVFLCIECVLYALMMGGISMNLTNIFLHLPALFHLSLSPLSPEFWVNIMLSFGAGIHEEFFFRFLCIRLFLGGFEKLFPASVDSSKVFTPLSILAILISSLIFSGFHYVGEYGDVFQIDSFLFRTVSGLYLSVIFVMRGFGVCAWTHALYDVFLLTGLLE